MTLDEKISLALMRLEKVAKKWGDRTRVAWTGGKDSTVALDLWRRVLAAGDEAAAINLDTGHKFPEVIIFRNTVARQWQLDLHIEYPESFGPDYPLAKDKVSCCRDLKIEPLRRAVQTLGVRALITGLRADEHENRASRQWLERRRDPHYLMINPILEFTEMDVWSYHMQRGLPYCELYDAGYRSLGCMPCTAKPGAAHHGERGGRDQEKERSMETLRNLGYF